MGAAGHTALEMANVLKFPSISKADVSDSYHNLIDDLRNSSSLRIANKIFIRDEYSLKPAYMEFAKKSFYSSARRLNFSNSAESAHIVNHWVAKQTNNKIHDIIDPSLITRDSRAIIANAIYFKGFWTYRFDTEETRKFPFWVGGDEKEIVQVDMMHVKVG
jgi:serpin B